METVLSSWNLRRLSPTKTNQFTHVNPAQQDVYHVSPARQAHIHEDTEVKVHNLRYTADAVKLTSCTAPPTTSPAEPSSRGILCRHVQLIKTRTQEVTTYTYIEFVCAIEEIGANQSHSLQVVDSWQWTSSTTHACLRLDAGTRIEAPHSEHTAKIIKW